MATSMRPVQATLRDGARVLIRPIQPEDRERLLEGFERLSERSRYRRFMAPVPRLTEAQLRYLTEVDHVDHEALVAVADEPGQRGLGVARYVRVPGDDDLAEAAVTVVDEYHGRGLGTLLLVLLARVAIGNGIRRFRAYVLEENRPMRHLLEQLGAEVHHDSPGIVRMEAELPQDPDAVPETVAGDVLRAVATGRLPEVATERPATQVERGEPPGAPVGRGEGRADAGRG